MEKETYIVLILKRAVPLEYVLCWLLKYIKEPKWLILYLCENGFEAALNLTVLLWEWFLLYQWICAYCVFWHKSAEARFVRVFVCVGVGGPAYVHTCVLSGSRATAGVLAFSLKKKKKTSSSLFIHLIVKPPLCRSFVSGSRSLPASRSGSFPFVSSCHCLPYVVYLMYIDWFLHDCGSAEPREGVSRNWQGC